MALGCRHPKCGQLATHYVMALHTFDPEPVPFCEFHMNAIAQGDDENVDTWEMSN